CFLCEQEGGTRIVLADRRCDRCPEVAIPTAPKLLLHNAAHILTEPELAQRAPCGFCLRANGECRIVLQPGKTDKIDIDQSTCKNLMKIQLRKAGTYSKTSPCTNAPVRCPLCPSGAEAIWKYNLRRHIEIRHPGCLLEQSRDLWEITDQEREHVVRNRGIKRRRTREDNLPTDVSISEAHCSTSVLQ
ncbi:hypothetical protein BDV93DRAFT_447713, partial [Ceratobasidium sp. AG-I]